MKQKIVWTVFAALLLVILAAVAPADNKGAPANPTLFEKRFQANQLAATFPVNPDIARIWVPPPFELALDAQGNATGVLAVIQATDYSRYITPNNPPLDEGENIAPDFVVHFWFVLQGNAETIPVPGATITGLTSYYYDVIDLVTNPVAHRIYRRAGRPATLVRDITFVDQGATQTGQITFRDGSKITFTAATSLLPAPIKVGGNFWQWHVGGLGEMGDDLGVRLEPATGNPGNLSTTHGQFLGLTPGKPNSTQTTIYADAGTCFDSIFGMTYTVSVKGTFLKPNNIVLNASRGDLMWTVYPSPLIPVPPALPLP